VISRWVAKLVGFGEHAAKQTTDFGILFEQRVGFLWREIATVKRCFDPVLRFLLFAIRVGEFAGKMLFILSL
jgi:hypothetical protein